MLQNGADLKSLQELMGHEDITATQVYLSVTKNRIKDVYEGFDPESVAALPADVRSGDPGSTVLTAVTLRLHGMEV